MVAPPWFEVPPGAYGGIESLVHSLVQGLEARGHHVLLVGAGSDRTSADFFPTYRDAPSDRLGELLPELVHAARAARRLDQADLDLIHDHSAAGPLLSFGRTVPTVVTAHGPVHGEIGEYYRSLGPEVGLVAISESQRRRAPDLPWVATVHNAIPVFEYPFESAKGEQVVFLGRMNPDKGPHLAIEAARACGVPLAIAAKCTEPDEREYFATEVEPRLGHGVSFLGEVGGRDKKDLLAGARCLIMPIQWDEPFGLVMIEALACGTPVVALGRGSVPEIVVDGVTGFVCDGPDQLSDALRAVGRIEPRACRADAESRFDVDVMVSGYERVYRSISLLTER